VYTATGANDLAATIAAGAVATGNITVGMVVYAAAAGAGTEVVYTAQTNVDTTAAGFAITFTDNAAVGSNATTFAAAAPTTDGVAAGNTADLDAGTITIAGVETIELSSNDTTTSVVSAVDENTLTVVADTATTINVSGAADLDLTTTAANLAILNAAEMTGNLTYTDAGATAGTIVTGGAGNDVLTAVGSNDVLNGGAGDDTLTGDDLSQLTGGAGADTFVMNLSSNSNSYSTITDLQAGDVIEFTGGNVVFSSAAQTLGSTASFDAYTNATVVALDAGANDAGWFQFGGNTYIVQSDDDVSNTVNFENGEDAIIQITGLVDLSSASYNLSNGTLEIA
jgi:S-layer protein